MPVRDDPTDLVGALEGLSRLHQSRLLIDDEFKQAKALALDDQQ